MADTISFFDSTMGAVLYTAVGYARYVDQLSIAGQPRYDGQSRIYESGIGRRYVADIVHVDVPPAFDNLVTKNFPHPKKERMIKQLIRKNAHALKTS